MSAHIFYTDNIADASCGVTLMDNCPLYKVFDCLPGKYQWVRRENFVIRMTRNGVKGCPHPDAVMLTNDRVEVTRSGLVGYVGCKKLDKIKQKEWRLVAN